jgi:5'-3' exonuclease
MTKRILLLDGDIICYQMTTVNEVELRWDDEIHTLHSDFKKVKKSIKDRVDHLINKVEGDEIVFCISDKENFRKSIYPEYKSFRKAVRKPLGLSDAREWIKEEFPVVVIPKLEADDVLGILSTSSKGKIKTSKGEVSLTGERIIVSEDKDFEQIPGKLWNPNKDTKVRTISLQQANYWFFLQALMGDATDGYNGCPKLGAVGATKILEKLDPLNVDQCWQAIVKAYEKQGLDEQYALTQARCARLLREEDYCKKAGVILWEPYREI